MNGIVRWEANGVNELITLSYNQTEVHKSTTGVDGVYSEELSWRTDLVSDQEEYFIQDTNVTDTDLEFYKTRHRTALGEVTEFSNSIGFVNNSVIKIDNFKVLVAYLSPENLQAQWQNFETGKILLGNDFGNNCNGNRPYTIGTDYKLVFALVYDSLEVEYGLDLTGATITFEILNRYKDVIKTKTTNDDITKRSQAVTRALGGTRGEFEVSWSDTELDDNGEAYESGLQNIRCTITWASGNKTREFNGQFFQGR